MKWIGLRAATHYQVDLPGGPFQPYLSGLTGSEYAHQLSGRPVRWPFSVVPIRPDQTGGTLQPYLLGLLDS